jgi:hypothetical protein
MVVLSVALGSKRGKLYLARDQTEISRTLVEDCMASLPQLIRPGQEHTFVEHNNLRLNYLPLNDIYIVTICDRLSNILEDVEILRALKVVIIEVLGQEITEASVCEKALEIIFVIDDVISLGYRNSCNEGFIYNSLKMESANEKMHELVERGKEQKVKEEVKKFLKEAKRKGPEETNAVGQARGGGGVGSPAEKETQFKLVEAEDVKAKPSSTSIGAKTTLKLGKKNEKEIKKEKKEAEAKAQAQAAMEEEEPKKVFNPLAEAVTFVTKEVVAAAIGKDGNVKSFEVKGQLSMTINDPSKGQIAVLLQKNEKYGSLMKVPPQFNKGTWGSESVLMPRDEKSSLPTTTAIQAIKYTVNDSKGEFIPFNINVWFTEGTLTLEIELNEKQSWLTELKEVRVLIPSKEKKYKVNSIENSRSEAAPEGEGILWTVPVLSKAKRDANIEIGYKDKVSEEDDLFPIKVHFESDRPLVAIEVKGVKTLEHNENVKFVHTKLVLTDEYLITLE